MQRFFFVYLFIYSIKTILVMYKKKIKRRKKEKINEFKKN